MSERPRELLPTASGRAVSRSMRRRLRPSAGTLAVAAVLLLVGTAASLVVPAVIGRIVDRVHDHAGPSSLVGPAVVILAALLVAAVASLAADLLVARVGESTVADLREEVLEHALALPLGQIEEAGSGDLAARVGNDLAIVADAVQRVLPGVLFTGLTIVLTLVGLAALDWRFAVAVLAVTPIQAATLRWYVRRCMPLYAEERVAEAVLGHDTLGSIRSADTVRAFRLGPRHVERIAARSAATNRLAYEGTRLRTRLYGRLNVAEAIGLSAVLAVGFLLVRSGSATIGAATAAALYFHRTFDPVNALVGLSDDLLLAGAGLARVVGVADTPMPRRAASGMRPADASVEVVDVGYAYRTGVTVLDGVSLDVAPGQHVAIVGASGAGKSTLVKLIAGVHEPARGRVRLGGVDVAELDPAAIRATVALVTQEVHVFAGTVADDLRLARPGATDDDLRDALAAVGATWAGELPDGLETVVGAAGHALSSLEAQQLALARVLLAAPPIVVLDEATAEAGSTGARLLERHLARVTAGRTAIVVGHRLSQAATADLVVVMERGQVVETGTHAALAVSEGVYGSLWSAWTGARDAQ